MLVDGGPSDTWPVLEARLARLPEGARQIDVAVVTHVDSDHIGGFLPFVRSDFAHEQVRDFWFNGRQHLQGVRSIEQGEDLGAVLTGTTGGAVLPWNEAYDGRQIATRPDGLVEVSVPDGGPHLTVLSPDAERLGALAKRWSAVLEKARGGSRAIGGPDRPRKLGDLTHLAAEHSP